MTFISTVGTLIWNHINKSCHCAGHISADSKYALTKTPQFFMQNSFESEKNCCLKIIMSYFPELSEGRLENCLQPLSHHKYVN